MADGKYFKVPPTWEIDMHQNNSNLRSLLFKVIMKADPLNMAKLRKAYPEEVAVYEAWMAGNGTFPTEVTIG